MKPFLILLLLAARCTTAAAQQLPDTIRINADGQAFRAGKLLTYHDLYWAMTGHPKAQQYVSGARAQATIAQLVAGAGGGLIGSTLVLWALDAKHDWRIAGAGLGLIAIAIPVNLGAKKGFRRGVRLYNDEVLQRPKPSGNGGVKVGWTGKGVGLQWSF